MPKTEEYQLHPLGWENDPEEERFKLSTLDYLSARTYNNYALFFKLQDPNKSKIVSLLKQGLERTLSQARHLAGTIERDPDGHHSFVKRKNSTVKFVVQHLDEPGSPFPSFSDLEKAHFVGTALGGKQGVEILSNKPMTYGEKAEADPDTSPAVASYKANFIPGNGLILNMHSHHYANDLVGWAHFTQQLAENCSSIVNNTPFPPWDPACLDRSRFSSPVISDSSSQVDAPTQADRHPSLKPSQSLIFHLPKSKAALLKSAASPPPNEGEGGWTSTYDACIALTWRVLTRLREPLYSHNTWPEANPIWAEGVNLTKRLANPTLPRRQQGNSFIVALSSSMAGYIPPPTISEITGPESRFPLWKLARYIRTMTNSVDENFLKVALGMLAPVRNKKDLSVRVDSLPPLTLAVTDWRDAKGICLEADFGAGELLGKPVAFRHLFGSVVSDGLVIVYPPKKSAHGGEDEEEGIELHFAFEKELVDQLLCEEEWARYFEFRGVDVDIDC
ncbi:Transferase [Rhypophila sp. PSN 637]